MIQKGYMKFLIGMGVLSLSLILFPHVVYAEKYYYLEDLDEWGIIESEKPLVCAFDFEDETIPNAKEDVLFATERSFLNWKQAFNNYAKYPDKWQIEFVVIPVAVQGMEKWDTECTIIINFLPEVDEELWDELLMEGVYDTLAITDNLGPISDLYVVYKELVYEEDSITEWHYEDRVDYELVETIDHELGHAFSLDHPTDLTMSNFEPYEDGYKVYSTMVTPIDIAEELIPLEYVIYYEITEYDIRSLENLYGENGFEEGKEIKLNAFQLAVKESLELYPEWFPTNYIFYLTQVGLLL